MHGTLPLLLLRQALAKAGVCLRWSHFALTGPHEQHMSVPELAGGSRPQSWTERAPAAGGRGPASLRNSRSPCSTSEERSPPSKPSDGVRLLKVGRDVCHATHSSHCTAPVLLLCSLEA